MSKIFDYLTKEPFIILAVIAALSLFIIQGDDLQFISNTIGGALVIKTIQAFVAGVVLMILVRLANRMRVLFSDGDPGEIKSNPVARAILCATLYVSFAIIVASVF
jgi:hypothetical protein